MRPYLIKEVAGFRVALVGLTTPALATWLPPETRAGFELLDPVEALRRLLREVDTTKPDGIVLVGHMGLTRRDDYANRIGALTREFPRLASCIGGHTHQNHASETVNRILYTQADHYGIYVGKVDLTFDRTSRRLLSRSADTVRMDGHTALDPLILSVAHSELEAADEVMAQPIGTLAEPFSVGTTFGQPSDMERLIGSSIIAALRKKGVEVDAVVHGLFNAKHNFLAGPKTVADAWSVLPYENEIVTIEVTREGLLSLAREFAASSDVRNIMGLTVVCSGEGAARRIDDLRASDGSPLPDKAAYRIALNTYDSQSGGQRFLLTAKLVGQASSRRVLHSVQIRDALIDFFVARQTVSRASLLV
jgi:2',3'-cyclic-nucleotide 2'-phosphodiesterase/3'-nucleotidase